MNMNMNKLWYLNPRLISTVSLVSVLGVHYLARHDSNNIMLAEHAKIINKLIYSCYCNWMK